MSHAAVLTTCQMPERSGLPSAVRGMAPAAAAVLCCGAASGCTMKKATTAAATPAAAMDTSLRFITRSSRLRAALGSIRFLRASGPTAPRDILVFALSTTYESGCVGLLLPCPLRRVARRTGVGGPHEEL